ncbi:hypothetical protein OEM_p100840 (plasmid) [Mycobacterium intracellulare subsp. yongonense 05-1390]|nr:hypothetical protein OEM_p100490 [Mycobacterium intracellulare subsp. yongonense 05-1390]AFV14864.1 hypothetical protein OEM_p100840 [Mycobacterium intracellulare subsp. yongonense 05-1390]BDE16984.1 hypothetical protein MKCMC460_58440 [Mycobacterium sp. 20KCMC460]
MGDRPRQPESDPADLGHPHPRKPAVEPLDMLGLHADLAKTFVHIGFAPPRAAMRAGEEVAHRLREISQGLLLHGLRARRQPAVFGTRGGQLSALLVIARGATTRPPMQLLLDRQVPHIAGMATMLGQHHRLPGSRKQPIPRHPANLALTTDNPPKGDAAFPPPA